MENEYKVLDVGEEKVLKSSFFEAVKFLVDICTTGVEIKYKFGRYKSKKYSHEGRRATLNFITEILQGLDLNKKEHNERIEEIELIIKDISNDIDILQGKERERYIFSLLVHFGGYFNILQIEKNETLANKIWLNNGIIEEVYRTIVLEVGKYAMLLDIILLERGINLLWYQEMSGIYLIEERDKRDYIDYLGSEKLVQRYIDEALPKLEPQQAPEPTNTKPQQEELTEREKQYYEKAITQGMAIKTDSGYKWLYCSGSKVSLVYFLSKVFCPKGVEQIPFKRLNNLWGVSRLDSANDQLANAKKPQRWRYDIDKLFENNI